jgi:hypothetical protein
MGAQGSIVVKALSYKPEGLGFETRWGEVFLPSYLIFLAALGPGVYSASTRNDYQKEKIYLGSKAAAGGQGWQTYRHLWADCLDNVVESLTSHNPIGLHGLLQGKLYFYFQYSHSSTAVVQIHTHIFSIFMHKGAQYRSAGSTTLHAIR